MSEAMETSRALWLGSLIIGIGAIAVFAIGAGFTMYLRERRMNGRRIPYSEINRERITLAIPKEIGNEARN